MNQCTLHLQLVNQCALHDLLPCHVLQLANQCALHDLLPCHILHSGVVAISWLGGPEYVDAPPPPPPSPRFLYSVYMYSTFRKQQINAIVFNSVRCSCAHVNYYNANSMINLSAKQYSGQFGRAASEFINNCITINCFQNFPFNCMLLTV